MNARKIAAWCFIFLGLISPIVASGYLLVKYPMAPKGFFIPQFPQIRVEVAAFLVAGAICFFFRNHPVDCRFRASARTR
jgi:hypothetical protein